MKVHHLTCGHFHPFMLAHPQTVTILTMLEMMIRGQLDKPWINKWVPSAQSLFTGLVGQLEGPIKGFNFNLTGLNWENELSVIQDLKQIPCNIMLIEIGERLILVDTGMGKDIRRTLPYQWQRLAMGVEATGQSAPEQIEAMGIKTDDVTDIIVTHMDWDHIGGLHHFPQAQVHLAAAEWEAIKDIRNPLAKTRYMPQLWNNEVKWNFIKAEGEKWKNFTSVQALQGPHGDSILIVPLPGHTPGHQGVALVEEKILFSADAFIHPSLLEKPMEKSALILKAYNSLTVVDQVQYQKSLKDIVDFKDQNKDWQVIGSHQNQQLED